MSTYIFDNAGEPAGQRFSSLETLYDPWTIRHLEATGITTGWHCWEVGAGGGSIAAWLGERCGTAGHVLVTDIDPRFLLKNAALAQPQIEVQRHDIRTDPLPPRTFDLIHARLVLIHLPAPEQALQRLVTALKPGGWLVVEDFDLTFIERGALTADDASDDASDGAAVALYQNMLVALGRLLITRGSERTWGRSLYRRLLAARLVEVRMDGYLAVWKGSSPGARMFQANFEQIRKEAVNAGFITSAEVDQVLALLDDPTFVSNAPMMFTACGRRPYRSVQKA